MYRLLARNSAGVTTGTASRILAGAARVVAGVTRVITGAVASGVYLALIVWLRDRPAGLYWLRLPAYWLSRAAWPFWLSTFGLTLVAILLAPRGGRLALPAAAFGTGAAYAGLLFLRESRAGVPFWGQVAAFWPDALLLGLALAAGAWTADLVTRLGRESMRPWRT